VANKRVLEEELMMQAGRRGLVWIGFLILIASVGSLSVASGAQEPLLLQRATRIASVKVPTFIPTTASGCRTMRSSRWTILI